VAAPLAAANDRPSGGKLSSAGHEATTVNRRDNNRAGRGVRGRWVIADLWPTACCAAERKVDRLAKNAVPVARTAAIFPRSIREHIV
jgi:hypothetical protein